MIENLEWFVLLLPGFFVYITLIRFLGSDEKRNGLETVFFSLIISIIISTILTIIEKLEWVTINLLDWRFGLWIIGTYLLLTFLLLLFFKKIFPWIENKTQIFDKVKSTSNDILFDLFKEELNNLNKPIWLHIITNDGLSFTGNLVMRGITKDKVESVCIAQPKITTKNSPYDISPNKRLFLSLKNIKYIGIINQDYSAKK